MNDRTTISSAAENTLHISRREFLTAIAAGTATLGMPRLAMSATRTKPNIVLIIADDQGYADLGVQGCLDIPTPNIDSIARNGVRFTNGYVTAPVCSPSRAGIQTGRYQARFGHEYNSGEYATAAPNFGLSHEETSLAERLKADGYATGLVGKWHLGYKPEYSPLKRGYDEFFGFLSGHHPYLWDPDKPQEAILRGDSPVVEKEYLTEAFQREAISFIDRHKDKPFFLTVAFNAIHTPLEATQKYLDRFTAIEDPKRKSCAAMLSAMDDAVGAVINKLKDADVLENTLIVYVSDNGGPTPSNASKNDPFSGYKGQLLEGGIHIPFLMQWVGNIPKGITCEQLVSSLDIHPTCLAAAGIIAKTSEQKALDGVNLLPYLSGEKKELPHEVLYWRYKPQSAVRKGSYKLLRMDGKEQLFNVQSDPGEKNNLLDKEPGITTELRDLLNKWDAELQDPAWENKYTPPYLMKAKE